MARKRTGAAISSAEANRILKSVAKNQTGAAISQSEIDRIRGNMKKDKNFSENLSIAGNMPNPKAMRVVKNMSQPTMGMSADMYSKSIGAKPSLPGRPVKGTLGASESRKAGSTEPRGPY